MYWCGRRFCVIYETWPALCIEHEKDCRKLGEIDGEDSYEADAVGDEVRA